ncbi:family 2 glycosyl transferase [Calothrix sp. NIES-4071]|nr:family 2 glycosyl transferase [Calothrix sp. NIES-4071]BAZ55867.1 family 2 glycosyl transferase [Calothrix sp. NIES-4105]
MEKLPLTTTTLSKLPTSPLVSVIIDNYNYGHFLREAIDSVFKQTYQNFELIVADDGSTDNSKEVIESYGNRLISIFQSNAGMGAALNTGIARSKGEIICFLDADDYFHPEKLENVVTGFIYHPQWVQIVHGKIIVNREGVPIGSGPKTFSHGDVRKLLLEWGQYIWETTSALSYRRQALEKVLPIPTKKSMGADPYLTAAVPFLGEVGCINKPLMFYRQHGNNMQSRSVNLSYWMEVQEETAKFINEAAAKAGINKRFNIKRSADYLSFLSLRQGGLPWMEALHTIWLSLQESIAIGRSFNESLNKLIQRSIFAFFPNEGQSYIRFGRRGYLRYKLTGKEPQEFKLSNN